MNKTPVAVIRINSYGEEVVVGHVPKNMSKIVINFLYLPHFTLEFFIIGKRINRGVGYGLEIAANFYFYELEKAINWLKNKINKMEEKLKENLKHSLKLNIEKGLIRIFLTLISGRVRFRKVTSRGKCQSGL